MLKRFGLIIGIISICTTLNAQTLNEILTRADEKIQSYTHLDTLIMDVSSTVKHMTSKWETSKITSIEKTVSIYGDSTHEEIHQATEENKGKVKDITKKVQAELQKAEKKQNQKKDNNKDEEGSMSLSLEELWMTEKDRENYDYKLLPDTLINNRWAHSVEIEAHFDADSLYEGTYYIEKETYDLILVDIKPSKNPKMVKEMQLRFWFAPVKNNQLLLQRTWTKIYASLLIKKFRIIVDESYSNYQFPKS